MYRTPDQVASEFIAEGKRRGISPRGIVICIATGLVETNLCVYASQAVPESLALPHDKEHVDAKSVGPLQQQVVMGPWGWWWSDAKTCMDPTTSAGLFYDRLARTNYNNLARSPGSFAADIQNPEAQYRGRYDLRMAEAQAIYDRLTGDNEHMIPRANADFWWRIALPRDRKPYGYGGGWNRDNVNVTTDCSGLVSNCLEALVRGEAGFDWDREPFSTESWRVLDYGQTGPFGTICVRSPHDIPRDAAVGIGLHHGGGGPESHMGATVFDPVFGQTNVESSGDYGQRIGGPARGLYLPDGHTVWNYWNDYAYLPGPIEGDDDLMSDNTPYESLSPYKRAGDPSHTLAEYIRYTDGSVHALAIEFGAITLGDPACIELVKEAADRGVARAQFALSKIPDQYKHPQA